MVALLLIACPALSTRVSDGKHDDALLCLCVSDQPLLHVFNPRRHRRSSTNPLAMSVSELEEFQRESGLVGEDAAVFSFEAQSLKSWGAFLAVLGTVLTALYYLWLNPDTGYGELNGVFIC